MKNLFILVLLFIGSVVCFADDEPAESSVITFKAVVLDGNMPYRGRTIPVHIDPMFPLLIKIVTSDSQLPEFIAGKMVKFAIHSPSQLFRFDDKTMGETFTFTVGREVKDGNESYCCLTVISKEHKK